MKLVGIDLGTCNSVIATMRDKRVEVIPNEAGSLTTPSVVFFNSSRLEEAIVGKGAVYSAGSNPERVVRLIKKQMGTDLQIRIDDQVYSPEQISSRILQAMIQDAEVNFFDSEKITDAVITVPAWFGIQQRDATKRAGELAGLTVRAIIAEPIAAAIDFAQTHGEALAGKTVLVYDLGGGTFDATLIIASKGSDAAALEFKVLNKAGSVDLGGYNWDSALYNHVAAEFTKAHPDSDPTQDLVSADRLMILCQEAKELLSLKGRDDKVTVACSHAGTVHPVEVTRREFELMTQHLLDESINLVSQLIEDTFREDDPQASNAALWDHVDVILLAGGSTKMPIVPETLERLSGKKPRTHRGVDLNVGRGAAYVAFSPDLWVIPLRDEPASAGATPNADGSAPDTRKEEIENEGPRIKLRGSADTASENIGISVVDPDDDHREINYVIIKPGTRCGQEIEQSFGIYEDGQTCVDIVINLGASKNLAEVVELGQAHIIGLPANTRRNEEVQVKLQFNGNGLIMGSATHVKSGEKVDINIQINTRKTEPGTRLAAL